MHGVGGGKSEVREVKGCTKEEPKTGGTVDVYLCLLVDQPRRT